MHMTNITESDLEERTDNELAEIEDVIDNIRRRRNKMKRIDELKKEIFALEHGFPTPSEIKQIEEVEFDYTHR